MWHRARLVGTGFLALVGAAAAQAQNVQVTGTITSAGGSGRFSHFSDYTGRAFSLEYIADTLGCARSCGAEDYLPDLRIDGVSPTSGRSFFADYVNAFEYDIENAGFLPISRNLGDVSFIDFQRRPVVSEFRSSTSDVNAYLEYYRPEYQYDADIDDFIDVGGQSLAREISYLNNLDLNGFYDVFHLPGTTLYQNFRPDSLSGRSASFEFSFGDLDVLNSGGESFFLHGSVNLVTISEVGQTADSPWLPDVITPEGGFEFFQAVAARAPIFFDPPVSVGYDYSIADGDPLIATAVFPTLPGDSDGFDIFALGGTGPALFSNVMGGEWVDFTTIGFAQGIAGFSLRDIDPAIELDPANPAAFATGLTFATSGTVTLHQTPVTIEWPITGGVPEPATWAMLVTGFGLTGCAMRRRQRLAIA